MANQVLGSDKILRLNDGLLPLVSSFDWAPNFNAQDIFEMGSVGKVDTAIELETSGSFSLNAAGNTAGLLARMAVNRNASGDFLGYKYNSGGAGGRNNYTFTESDLTEMRFDLVMHEKPDQKTFSRSLVHPCVYITGISGRIDTQGSAAETYNFAGTFVCGFQNPYHDVRTIAATRTTGTTATLVDASFTSTSYTLAYLLVDGKPFTNKTSDPTYATLGAAGVITITTTESYAIPVGAVISAVLYKSTAPSSTFPAVASAERFQTSAGAVINYVRGHMATVYLAPLNAGSVLGTDQWLKVQSLDYNVDLRIDTLRQVNANTSGSSVYARVPTLPLDISCNIAVTESDWADWKKLITFDATNNPLSDKTQTGANVHAYTYTLDDFWPKFAVVVKYYTKAGNLCQETRFTDMRVDGMGIRQAIGGRGEVSWALRGTTLVVQGFNP
jgi:hypothetical protein